MSDTSPADAFLKYFPGWLKPIGGGILWFAGLFSEKAALKRKPVRFVSRQVHCYEAKQKDGKILTQVDVRGFVTNVGDMNLLLVNAYVREHGFDAVRSPLVLHADLPAHSGVELTIMAFLPRETKPETLEVILEDNLDRQHVRKVKVDRHF